jgi:hypothetical protein
MCLQVRSSNSHSGLTTSQVKRIISSLGELRGALEKMFDISLPAPCFPRGELFLTCVKKFCGGLLESGTTHLWRRSVRVLSKIDRLTVSSSLFLFRKVLPTPEPSLDDYMDRMSTPSPPSDPKFLSFVDEQMPRMFRDGWDRSYVDSVLRFSPSTSSCFEKGRLDGGCRGMSVRGEWLSRFDAVEFCLSSPSPLPVSKSRLCSVDTGGKKRIISVPQSNMNLLRPLHVAMYDHLSKFPWLLRGDAKASRFSDFTLSEGEIFVSGDYESATDNLSGDVQSRILGHILDGCRSVPSGIREMAAATLRMELSIPKSSRSSVQARGQLMGNLLSFPLLCIVNFLALKYAIRRKVPLRINGDDIVFRARREEVDRWVKVVGSCGLTLSMGKTMFDRQFFSLNSCWFRSMRMKCRMVPTIRSTALGLGARGDADSLGGRFRAFAPGFGARKRHILVCLFLRKNSGLIHSTNRSVTRCLGMSVSFDALVESRLWARESFYLSMEKERPLPPAKSDLSWHVRVPGWVRTYGSMTKADRALQKVYTGESVDHVWSTPPVKLRDLGEKYWLEVKDGTFAFSSWLEERKVSTYRWSRLMGVGRKALSVLFKPRKSLFYRWPRPIRKSWFFIRDVSTVRRNIKFVAAAN